MNSKKKLEILRLLYMQKKENKKNKIYEQFMNVHNISTNDF